MSGKGISLLERWNRRTFLQGALASAGGLVLGCGGGGGSGNGGDDPGPAPPTPQCPNAFAGGMQIDELTFANEDPVAFGTPIGEGLDGRLFFDLSQLAPGALITPNELFYVRTRRPDLLDPAAPWQIDVSGLVDAPRALSLSDIEPLVQPMGAQLLECALGDLREAFTAPAPNGESAPKKKKKVRILEDELGDAYAEKAEQDTRAKSEPVDGGMDTEEFARLVMPFVEGNGDVTLDDIEEYSRLDRKVLRHHLGALVKEGRLERIGVGRHAVYSSAL